MAYTPQVTNKISTTNSYSSSLSGSQVFQGVGEDVSQYGRAGVSIWTPFPSPTAGTITFEVSRDNVNWGGPTRRFEVTNVAQPHMWNIVEQYFRIKYVPDAGTANTAFQIQTQYSVNADVLLGHPLDEVPLPEHEALQVKAVGWGTNPVGTYIPLSAAGTLVHTSASLSGSEVYSSAISSTIGYQQVSTTVVSDVDGTATFDFYHQATDPLPIRTLNIPYSASTGFQLLSAPAFADYVKYSYTNGAVTQSSFHYETKLLTSGLIGQVLPLNAGVSAGMVANLGKNVVVGQEPDGTFSNQRVDGVAFITSTTLSGSEVYVSSLVSTAGYSQIETHLYSDVGGTLVGNWYTDTSKTTLIRTFTRPYVGSGTGSVSYFASPVFGPYVEYTYTNGIVGQSSFFLDFHPRVHAISGQILGVTDFIPQGVVANLGRSVIVGQDQAGNFRNATVDEHGDQKVHIHEPTTAFGELMTADMEPVIQMTFPYNINTTIVTPISSSTTATITQANQMAVISTGASSNVSASLESIRRAKYRAGQGIDARFTALFTTGSSVGTQQLVGIGSVENGNPQDGYFFAMSGSSFGAWTYNQGVGAFVSSSGFSTDTLNGGLGLDNPSGMNIRPEKGNVFGIKYQWLGFGAIKFYVEDPTEGFYTEVHRVAYANSNIVPSSANATFPITYYVNNGANAENVEVKTASGAAFIGGKNKITGPTNSTSSVIAHSNGQSTLIFALEAAPQYPSGSTNTNRISSYIRAITLSNEGANNTIVDVSVYEDATITSPVYNYIDVNNSNIRAVNGTYTVGTGRKLTAFSLPRGTGRFENLIPFEYEVLPGKNIAFVVTGDASTATDVIVSWVEDF